MRDPVILEAVRGLRSGNGITEERPLGPLKGSVLDAAVALLAEHVPDHERQVGRPSRRLDSQVFLRHFRPNRRDVIVRELVDDEASDQAGLPHRAVAKEQELSLDALIVHGDVSPCWRYAYNGWWLNVRDANTPSIRVETEPRPEESRGDCVRLREERNVPIPFREDGCVGLLELPHRDLQFP